MLRCYSSRWEPGSPGAVASLSRGSRSTATGLPSSTTTTTMWVVALFNLVHHFTPNMLSLYRPTCQVSRWTMWQTTKSAYQRAGTPPSSGLQPPLSVLCRCQTFKDNIHSSLRLAMVLGTCKILSKLFVEVTWDFHVQRTSTFLFTGFSSNSSKILAWVFDNLLKSHREFEFFGQNPVKYSLD